TLHSFPTRRSSDLWISILYWLVKQLKHPLNMMLAFGLMAGHSWGSSTWFTSWLAKAGWLSTTNRPLVLLSWMFMVFYFGLVGVCAGLAHSKYIHDYQEKRMPPSI